MRFQTTIRTSAMFVFALVFAQLSFAAPVSTCVNTTSGPDSSGLVSIGCNLYYNGSPNTFNLAPLMTQSGALLSNNDFFTNYTVIINGNPNTLTDDASGLFNTSLWEAVLYDAPGGDPDGPLTSDTLDMFWPGSFPSGATVESEIHSIYGSGFDSDFFVQATGSETIIGAGTHDVFNVFTPAATPEPASLTLMATGLLGIGLFAGMRRMRSADSSQI